MNEYNTTMATQKEMNKRIVTAVRSGDVDTLQDCIYKGAEVNCQDYDDVTPLHIAAVYARTEVVDLLLKSGASPSVVNNQGQTPLHRAAQEDRREIVELLLKSGASPSVVDNEGQTPLHRAVVRGRTEVLDLLLKSEASPSVVDYLGETPLHKAAVNGRTVIVDFLLKSGASPSVVDKQGQTPLHCAANNGKTEAVFILLKSGALPSAVTKWGETPLHKAAEQHKTEVVYLLLKSGASPSVMNCLGQTPLHEAAVRGRTKVVDLLLKSEASPSVVDYRGQTPLHKAAEEHKTEVVDLLLKSQASPSVADNEGVTPLHRAAESGSSDVVYLLLKYGASPSVVDKNGKTPYHVACHGAKDLLQKYMDMPINTDEIVAQIPMMGTNGENNELLSKDTFVLYENCVYLGGASNVGKSTLASILIGEEIPQHWKSTDGLTTYFGRNGIDIKNRKMVPLEQATIQENIKEEIRKGTYKIEIAPSDLFDFGGQRSFDMTQQLFRLPKGTFVLMFNGKIDLSCPLNKYDQKETTEAILKYWVDSILSYCADDKDILPIIMFCATHSDDFNQEKRILRKKELIRDLGEIFKNHELESRIIYNDIFFINGKEKTDPEINRLKSTLVEVAFQQNSWGKKMPMAWVLLDLQLSELRINNMNIISKEELITLNRRNEDLYLTDKQTKDFLNVQHSLGKILYFDQLGLDHFIIVQPQSLVNILRSFITDELFWPKEEELRGILCSLTNTGQIAKQDLLKLWSQEKFHQHMRNDDFKEFIIQVLFHLDILVEPNHDSQEQESKVQSYIVPCIEKCKPPVTDIKSADKMICDAPCHFGSNCGIT